MAGGLADTGLCNFSSWHFGNWCLIAFKTCIMHGMRVGLVICMHNFVDVIIDVFVILHCPAKVEKRVGKCEHNFHERVVWEIEIYTQNMKSTFKQFKFLVPQIASLFSFYKLVCLFVCFYYFFPCFCFLVCLLIC